MENKAVIILADGMRPDCLEACGHPFIEKMLKNGAAALDARAVMPSVTLPCHMSLFHSVEPDRHGILTNTYTPQVRYVPGLCEQLKKHGKTSAMFYDWEELRDLARPGSTAYGFFISGDCAGYSKTAGIVAEEAEKYICASKPDFAFVYFGYPDAAGHNSGWMGEEYMDSVRVVWDSIESLVSALPPEYTVIVTADHGGHGRGHGSDMDEDMYIPVIINGSSFAKNSTLKNVSIIDLAPTVAALLGVPANEDWEGKSLININ